jgi:2-keto-4-pentenoate hydratase/2-oxohepta-3-ene-1,7-dioic acid hydratase in catechol pathway
VDQNGNLTQVFTAKSFDTFAPLGPMLATSDEIDDPYSLQIKLWVNDELRQDFNSRDYIYRVNQAIEFCSQFFTLFPGDIISMGSGPGNAFFWKKYLEVGDRGKATIDGLGVQAFSIAAEV